MEKYFCDTCKVHLLHKNVQRHFRSEGHILCQRQHNESYSNSSPRKIKNNLDKMELEQYIQELDEEDDTNLQEDFFTALQEEEEEEEGMNESTVDNPLFTSVF